MGRASKPLSHRAMFTCAVPLEHIAIRSDGIGRTVEAYAAVFGEQIERNDWYYVDPDPFEDDYGPHLESIAASAFKKSLTERGLNFQVLFNHGKTIQGMPAERYSMPIGTPIEITPDRKGLLTVTRYAVTPLADEILELIQNDSIRSQSFSGEVLQAVLTPRKTADDLDEVEFTEIALREYGPCTFPAYPSAEILSVRAEFLASHIAQLPAAERELVLQRASSTPDPAALAPVSGPLTDTPDPAALAPVSGPSTQRLVLEQDQRRRATAAG